MTTTRVGALGALVLLSGLVSGCATEEPGASPANLTAGAAADAVFEDFILLGDAGTGQARPLEAGRLDPLAAEATTSDEFPSELSDADKLALNAVAGRYFVEQVVDSEVIDVKDVEAIRAHATGLSELLTPGLAAELAGMEPTWDTTLFPTNLGAVGMTADPARETVAGTRFADVDLRLTRFDGSATGERPVLVYQADTLRPVVGGAGEPLDEHRTIVGTFELERADGQWLISDLETELTTVTTAPGEQLG